VSSDGAQVFWLGRRLGDVIGGDGGGFDRIFLGSKTRRRGKLAVWCLQTMRSGYEGLIRLLSIGEESLLLSANVLVAPT
jgi:hypothetical protein